MLRRVGDQVTHLPVALAPVTRRLDQQRAVGGGGVDEAERTVTDAADDQADRICVGDLGGKRIGETEIKGGAQPPAR